MINNWQKIALHKHRTIKEAMEVLSETVHRIVLVVSPENTLLGAVTDGDIRRGILNGHSIDDPVEEIMNKTPLSTSQPNEARHMMKEYDVLAIPIVDDKGCVIAIETIAGVDDVQDNVAVVLMAGGFGKRMMPLTKELPKPMLPIQGKPIIEHVINNLKSYNFNQFYITTHYKGDIIKDHFTNYGMHGVNIDFVNEDEPLGTAGSLSLLKDKIETDFIVMNSDLLAQINFKSLVQFHQSHNEIATMCVKQYNHQIPFGVVSVDDVYVESIVEKPQYSYFINAGIYCFKKEVFNYVDHNSYLDMPDLMQKIMSENKKICTFPVHENWVDLGNMQDYEKVKLGDV